MEQTKRSYVDRKTAYEITKFLDTVIVRHDGSDLVSYKDGWSDHLVAAEFHCSGHNVRGIRHIVFGNLVAPRQQQSLPLLDPDRVEGRLTGLEARVARLELFFLKSEA